jgi:2'-5' RNA ligase
MAPWFAPSLSLPADARAEIKAWVDQQDWPEGTKLKDPESYHITVLYSPDAYGTPEAAGLMKYAAQESWDYGVRVTGFEAFSSGDDDGAWTPAVLVLGAPLLQLWGETLLDEAEARGINISRHDEYRPHITVAVLPPGASLPSIGWLPGKEAKIGFPLKFQTEPELRDLHEVYDERKRDD